jgi:cytoskeletal protein RodZ
MWLLFVEAGVAMFLLVFIVWWTMFQGRKPDQRPREESSPATDDRQERE